MALNHYRFFFDEDKYTSKEDVVGYFKEYLCDAINIQVAIVDEKTKGYGFLMLSGDYIFSLYPNQTTNFGFLYSKKEQKYINFEDFTIEFMD